MPKNKGKGGKNRRRGKNESEDKRELQTKIVGQEYGQVTRMLGNGRLECYCFDGKNRMCHIRGKMRKREWVNQGDIVLIGLREYQDDKGDIILKFQADEARALKSKGLLPRETKIEDGDDNRNRVEDFGFEFTDRVGSGSDSGEDVGTQPAARLKSLPNYDYEGSTESSSESDSNDINEKVRKL